MKKRSTLHSPNLEIIRGGRSPNLRLDQDASHSPNLEVIEGGKSPNLKLDLVQHPEDWPLQSSGDFEASYGIDVTDDDILIMRGMLNHLRQGHPERK